MLQLLWLIPILPLAGFCILIMTGARMPRKAVSVLAVGPVAVSCVIAILVAAFFVFSPPAGNVYTQSLGTWFNVSGLQVGFGFYLDSLSLVMATVVTVVGLLIFVQPHFELHHSPLERLASFDRHLAVGRLGRTLRDF